ncbi:MAG: hypothetical protein ACKVHE_15895 [Planctomycetales bacterium]
MWWPREGVEQNDVEGWIERIQLRVGDDARVLVVASHCSEHGRVPQINQEALKRRFSDIIVGFHAVDSREMYKIDELKTAIAQPASFHKWAKTCRPPGNGFARKSASSKMCRFP